MRVRLYSFISTATHKTVFVTANYLQVCRQWLAQKQNANILLKLKLLENTYVYGMEGTFPLFTVSKHTEI